MHQFRTHIFLLCLSIGFSMAVCAQDSLPVAPRDTLHESIITTEFIGQLVKTLSADDMRGRMTGSKEIDSAAAFIRDEFRKAGALPLAGNDGYFAPFIVPSSPRHSLYGTVANNVVAALPGKSRTNEIVVFCAHYDHIGTEATNPNRISSGKAAGVSDDKIFNGANDNASGVAAMLAIAKYYGRLKNNERTILFIAFSGEEIGLAGSRAFIGDINADYFTAVINLEMLGRTSLRSKGRPYITGNQYSDLITILNNELEAADPKKYRKDYFRKDPYGGENLFMRSDNIPFAELGIPAHTIMAGSPIDDEYHSVDDEYESLNIKAMTEFVQAIALATRPIVDGSLTPRRINPKRLRQPKVF